MTDTLLITGGAGFVGSNLALRFKRDRFASRVVALDNLKRRGSELNIPRLRQGGVEFVHGDIRNQEDMEAAGAFDLLIECSAEPSVLAGFQESPAYLINTNLLGTVNCLEAVRKYRAGIVFLSTSRVYPIPKINALEFQELKTRLALKPRQKIIGVSRKGISEALPLEGFRTLYGATKLASELLLQEYLATYDLRGIINRCGVLTGPWQMGKVDQGFVVLWVARHIYQGWLAYIGYGGKGKQVRDILHVDDLYDLLCLQLKDLRALSGQVYNVGGGPGLSVSLLELTRLCQEVTGQEIEIDSIAETRLGDIPYFVADSSRVQAATNWQPKRTLREIIQEIACWIEQNRELLQPILA
jgi:CDP-paratose 2-epimerase